MLLYLCLWGRFLLMIGDPYWSGASLDAGLPVYRDWRLLVDWWYWVSGLLMMPLYTLYGWLAPSIPKVTGFPGFYAAAVPPVLLDAIETLPPSLAVLKSFLQSASFTQTFLGYVDWLTPLAVLFYRVLEPLLDPVGDFLKNLVWNILIELSFTKRKEGHYREALEKRAADLMKLNVEYRHLSHEASMLAVSVVTDELTKVYNKRFFIEKIAYEFQIAKKKQSLLAVAMVDIDHFKKLNDTYGHLLGDKVLQAVAQVAKRNTPADSFCCRFGGEEFTIIMPGKNATQARQVVSEIHTSLPLLRFQEDENLRTSASFGLCAADFRHPDAQALESFEHFIKLADDKLYQAKLNGRNRIETHIIG
jgi:diguanylate cyclase (GGDEF)-like protein